MYITNNNNIIHISMLLLSVLLVVNYQQEPHLKVLYMQSPVDHRTYTRTMVGSRC